MGKFLGPPNRDCNTKYGRCEIVTYGTARAQVWGEGIHVGRYDLLKGMDTNLEGMARIVRASALTREVVIDKLFPKYLGPSDGLTVMEMGSGFGTLARDVAQKKGCKVSDDHSSKHDYAALTQSWLVKLRPF